MTNVPETAPPQTPRTLSDNPFDQFLRYSWPAQLIGTKIAGGLGRFDTLGEIMEKPSEAKVDLIVTCIWCQRSETVSVSSGAARDWQNGTSILQAMPELPPEKRELLTSNTCGTCIANMQRASQLASQAEKPRRQSSLEFIDGTNMKPMANDQTWSRHRSTDTRFNTHKIVTVVYVCVEQYSVTNVVAKSHKWLNNAWKNGVSHLMPASQKTPTLNKNSWTESISYKSPSDPTFDTTKHAPSLGFWPRLGTCDQSD